MWPVVLIWAFSSFSRAQLISTNLAHQKISIFRWNLLCAWCVVDTEGHSVAHHSGTRYVGSSSQASISVPFPTCGSVQMCAQVQLTKLYGGFYKCKRSFSISLKNSSRVYSSCMYLAGEHFLNPSVQTLMCSWVQVPWFHPYFLPHIQHIHRPVTYSPSNWVYLVPTSFISRFCHILTHEHTHTHMHTHV